ncbi:hypothetical protein C8034_v009214 [Colletotrichum sidae]|uniref:Uncharacterized protein n=1 Tax=Colletotrichum sidae TaxID=1347389 RepID=A0A4R8TNV2_9PEZI|nr:hypothetical protein C8034_v009214 [Colletotrichum sidae]
MRKLSYVEGHLLSIMAEHRSRVKLDKAPDHTLEDRVTPKYALLQQAVGRIDRRGQPLATKMFTLQSTDQPGDMVVVEARDRREQQFGADGVLASVSRFIGKA